jgi:hypothetical protein
MHSEGTRNRRARAALAIATLSAMTLGAAFGAHHTLAAPHVATTFTVTNTLDSGTGSLRQAILNANSNPGADTINFNIPGNGVHRISPTSALPGISEAVTIDGYSQPGASANSNPFGQGVNPTLLVELNGDNISWDSGLVIGAPNTVIRGLVINGFDGDTFRSGIYINTTNVNCLLNEPRRRQPHRHRQERQRRPGQHHLRSTNHRLRQLHRRLSFGGGQRHLRQQH